MGGLLFSFQAIFLLTIEILVYTIRSMSRKNCVYCNKEITTRSSEHVIQNALGGLLESEDICCPECNNHISREIDKPFTTIFNPILGNIENLGKTNNKDSMPAYSGTVKYQGATYSANFKGKNVTSCPELSKKLRCDASKLPLETVSYDFNLQNDIFQTGMAKIAFNYALAKNVNLDLLKPGLHIDKNGKIEYRYPIVPFYPLNELDILLELNTPTELYHNMILFSQHDKLWCYIDLFNTFQYCVLLVDNLPKGTHIYDSYMQTLQKLDRSEPNIKIFDAKDAMIYAQQYGVEPTMNEAEMKERIRKALERKSQKQPMHKIIEKKMAQLPVFSFALNAHSPEHVLQTAQTLQLYFDDYDNMNEETFRTQTITPDGRHVIPYPDAIMADLKNGTDMLKTYTTAKFHKLTAFLNKKTK